MADQIKHNNYKFSQSFGADNEEAAVQPEDVISSLEFNSTGGLLCVGDVGGRLVVFKRKSKCVLPQFDAVCEYTAFRRDFDILRSQEISPEILNQAFLQPTQTGEHILASTERDVRLFKISDHLQGYKCQNNGQFPIRQQKKSLGIRLERSFDNASKFHLNALCVSPQQDSFLVADDFSITQFYIEDHHNGLQLINNQIHQLDLKLNLITTATYHPQDANLILAGYSSGQMRLYDLRTNLKQTSLQAVGNGQPVHHIRINEPNLIFQRTSQSLVISDIRNLNKSLFSMNLNPLLQIKEQAASKNRYGGQADESFKPKIITNQHEVKFNLSISRDQKFWASGYYGNQLLIGNLQNDVLQFRTTRLLKKMSKSELPGAQLGARLVMSRGEVQKSQFHENIIGRVEKCQFSADCLAAASGGNLFIYGWTQ